MWSGTMYNTTCTERGKTGVDTGKQEHTQKDGPSKSRYVERKREEEENYTWYRISQWYIRVGRNVRIVSRYVHNNSKRTAEQRSKQQQ